MNKMIIILESVLNNVADNIIFQLLEGRLQNKKALEGTVYATISMKTVVSVAIRKYKYDTDLQLEKLEYQYCLLLEPIQEYLVRIRSRKGIK